MQIYSRFKNTIARQPFFAILVFIGYIQCIFHFTGASGSWITYEIKNYKETVGITEIKIGLFNAATNNSWHLAPYHKCINQIVKNSTVSLLSDHYLFCNAQLANGVIILISLMASVVCSALLSLIILNAQSFKKVLLEKKICLILYSLSALINLIAFSLGAGVLKRLTTRDFPGSFYGIGFVASVICFILSTTMLVGVYFLIDRNGSTRNFSVLLDIKEGNMADNAAAVKRPSISTTNGSYF